MGELTENRSAAIYRGVAESLQSVRGLRRPCNTASTSKGFLSGACAIK
jgi:hypothetical protein